ncbi:tetratricopeptide repeat protein [Thiospirillum jenense]|nr:tetratricopeptide repeat protein [Thiospirillum jenense]
MNKPRISSLIVCACLCFATTAFADSFDDGLRAYIAGDYAKAFQIMQLLAEQGNAKAQSNLGVMYENGRGVAQDYAEAVRWFRKAADQGDAKAQLNFGVKYFEGRGIKQDYAEALRWFRKAADQGFAQAQSNLGVMYAEGQGVTQDDAEALKWFKLAEAAGNTDATKACAELSKLMTPEQIATAQQRATEWMQKRQATAPQ